MVKPHPQVCVCVGKTRVGVTSGKHTQKMQRRSKRQEQVFAAKRTADFAVVAEQGANPRCGVSRSTYMHAEDAGEPLLSWAAALVECNMRRLYETSPGWTWDAPKTRRELQHPATRLVVCWAPLAADEGADEGAEEPVAFAAIRFETAEVAQRDGWAVYVYELQVEPAVRGRGVGSHLLALVAAVAAQAGATMLRLTCFTANTTALAFYTRHGFVLDPISPGVGEASHVILRKRL